LDGRASKHDVVVPWCLWPRIQF